MCWYCSNISQQMVRECLYHVVSELFHAIFIIQMMKQSNAPILTWQHHEETVLVQRIVAMVMFFILSNMKKKLQNYSISIWIISQIEMTSFYGFVLYSEWIETVLLTFYRLSQPFECDPDRNLDTQDKLWKETSQLPDIYMYQKQHVVCFI
jgi:hypothetical protein